MSWFPCTTSTSGNGPSPCGYHTRPLIGSFLKSKPQYLDRDLATSGGAETSADPSTVRVLSVTESLNAGRRLSVPLPYTSVLTASVPLNPGFGAEEHTSELQSHSDLVCRLLLEKK